MNPQAYQQQAGLRAESRVLSALGPLPAPWQVFPAVEWRTLSPHGEHVGEADVVVFHPQQGLFVFEIKAGAVQIRDGRWFYASGLEMKQSPFSQARRNRYALAERMEKRLGGRQAVQALRITHAAWFPEVDWNGPLPGTDVPSRAFLFDRQSLKDPLAALQKLAREAFAADMPGWTPGEQRVLRDLLAPDCHLLVPLGSRVDDTVAALHQASTEQVRTLRLLRTQSRLLIEGGAGSGKTLLAITLAREHAARGRSVLLTCFNKALAQHLAAQLDDVVGLTVCTFHELVRLLALQAGLGFQVPEEAEARKRFFREETPELLLAAAEQLDVRFDTLIVDEAADFSPTWWIGLEALGAPGFAWHVFYDLQQSLFQSRQDWEPPFEAEPLVLEANLRNARPVGETAARLGRCVQPAEFRIQQGPPPVLSRSTDFDVMAQQLRQLLRTLLRQEGLRPEQIAVLSPSRPDNPASTWRAGLDEVKTTTELAAGRTGHVRIGTIQGFKGLEADVVILVGLTSKAAARPDWLYVGASRARAALYLLALEDTALAFDPAQGGYTTLPPLLPAEPQHDR